MLSLTVAKTVYNSPTNGNQWIDDLKKLTVVNNMKNFRQFYNTATQWGKFAEKL